MAENGNENGNGPEEEHAPNFGLDRVWAEYIVVVDHGIDLWEALNYNGEIVVVGGCGFIGSITLDTLGLETNHTYEAPNDLISISGYIGHPGESFIKVAVTAANGVVVSGRVIGPILSDGRVRLCIFYSPWEEVAVPLENEAAPVAGGGQNLQHEAVENGGEGAAVAGGGEDLHYVVENGEGMEVEGVGLQQSGAYHSEGIEKAEELIVGCTAQASSNNKAGPSNEIGQASISGTSEESQEFSRKRPRIESSGDALFDLDLRGDAH